MKGKMGSESISEGRFWPAGLPVGKSEIDSDPVFRHFPRHFSPFSDPIFRAGCQLG
jgi:hypothetical protein